MTKKENKDSIDVDYLANLARIELTAQEKESIHSRLISIIQYLHKLDAADISNVQPTAHAIPAFNIWEDDEPIIPLTPEQALMNAPQKKDNQVVVPKTVE